MKDHKVLNVAQMINKAYALHMLNPGFDPSLHGLSSGKYGPTG